MSKQNSHLKEKINNYKAIIYPELICCVCYERPKEYINTQCGHKSVCFICCQKINDKCPLCKQDGNYIKVYE